MKITKVVTDLRSRQWLAGALIFAWSVFIYTAGQNSIVSDVSLPAALGITSVQAADVTNPPIIRLDKERLSGENLGEFSPYEPEYGDLVAKGHDYFYSADEQLGIGVWESKPGAMTFTDLSYDELMYVIEGSMVMTGIDGVSATYSAGEGFILPRGWSGTLAVPEGGVRKIWVSYEGGKKG
jgi:uncharacterized cupin superfamily protein